MTAYTRLPAKRRPYHALPLSPVARDVFESGLQNIRQAQQGRIPEAAVYAWQPHQDTGEGVVRVTPGRVSKAVREAQKRYDLWHAKDYKLLRLMATDHADGDADIAREIVNQAELRLWRHFEKGGTTATHAFMRQAVTWAADDVKRQLRQLMIVRSAETQEARAQAEDRERQDREWREALALGAQQLVGDEKRIDHTVRPAEQEPGRGRGGAGRVAEDMLSAIAPGGSAAPGDVEKPVEESLRTSPRTRALPRADGQAIGGALSARGMAGRGPYTNLAVDRASRKFASLFALGD